MAPTFRHGKATALFMNGIDASSVTRDTTITGVADAADVTTYGDNDMVPLAGGIRDGSFSADCFWDSQSSTATDNLTAHLITQLGGSTGVITTLAHSTVVSGQARLLTGFTSSLEIASPASDAVTLKIEQSVNGGLRVGRIVYPKTILTTTASATATNSGISGGSTSGGVGHFHLLLGSTITSIVGKIQHSSASVTWADIITFTATTTPVARRSTMAGAVKQYVRGTLSTFTGGVSKSATIFMAFARHGKQEGK